MEDKMKESKYCQMTSCLWGYRHEVMGVALLVIATFLTFMTLNAFGIVAMFLVGGWLCCSKHFGCCSCCCHSGDSCHSQKDSACHSAEPAEKVAKTVAKKKAV